MLFIHYLFLFLFFFLHFISLFLFLTSSIFISHEFMLFLFFIFCVYIFSFLINNVWHNINVGTHFLRTSYIMCFLAKPLYICLIFIFKVFPTEQVASFTHFSSLKRDLCYLRSLQSLKSKRLSFQKYCSSISEEVLINFLVLFRIIINYQFSFVWFRSVYLFQVYII